MGQYGNLGTKAEQSLMGIVLREPVVHYRVARVVTGDHFSDPRMGALYSGIGMSLASGNVVSIDVIESHFSEWGVRGISGADAWEWWATAPTSDVRAEQLADHILRDATRRAGISALTQALVTLREPSVDPQVTITELVREINGFGATAAHDWQRWALGELLDHDFGREQWVIPNLLEAGDRLVLTGVEGGGKSVMGRQLTIFSAAGIHPLMVGRDAYMREMPVHIDPVRSLVFDAENSPRQWRRSAWRIFDRVNRLEPRHNPRDNVQIITTGRINLTRAADVGQIHRHIDEVNPQMVYLGPLYKLAPGGLSKEDEAMQVIAVLDEIRDRGITLLIEAHSGHATEPNGRRSVRPRGSSALLGWPEFGFGIRVADPDLNLGDDVYEFMPWRGSREDGRCWPDFMRRGGDDDIFAWQPV